MYMTESEILAEWKGAKDRKKQISILADENCCTPEEIVAALKAAGVDGRAIRAPGDGMKKKKEGGDRLPHRQRHRLPRRLKLPMPRFFSA